MNSKVTKNVFYEDLQEAGRFGELEQRLMGESNLPGPRANLGAASTFADAFASDWVASEAWEPACGVDRQDGGGGADG